MAGNFDVEVVGIDPSISMVSFALERAIGLKRSVELESFDCTKKSYPTTHLMRSSSLGVTDLNHVSLMELACN